MYHSIQVMQQPILCTIQQLHHSRKVWNKHSDTSFAVYTCNICYLKHFHESFWILYRLWAQVNKHLCAHKFIWQMVEMFIKGLISCILFANCSRYRSSALTRRHNNTTLLLISLQTVSAVFISQACWCAFEANGNLAQILQGRVPPTAIHHVDMQTFLV